VRNRPSPTRGSAGFPLYPVRPRADTSVVTE